jgi:predicted phosphate transport protein (TIGR00153 family)
LSELIKWFEKRRETKAIAMVHCHLALTVGAVEDLEKAVKASLENREKEMQRYVERVASNEKEADALRRKVMDEISRGELSPMDREDLMNLIKRVDMVADWSRESTRVLGAIPMNQMPKTLQKASVAMLERVKKCTMSLQRCVNTMMKKPEEALKAADNVERLEEQVDDLHEKARILLGKEEIQKAGAAILISQLFEAIEMIADSCEDACDQVRVIMVRRV